MSTQPSRLVVATPPPSMSDTEFKAQLARYSGFLDTLKSPAQKRKTSLHPDIGRAVTRVEVAFRSARDAVGAEDPETYHQALVEVRQATASWRSVDDLHGEPSRPS